MTQLLLFDAPSDMTNRTLLPIGEAADASATAVVATSSQPNRSSEDSTNVVERLRSDSGLHHMGDLARLVLLRYDLMAKRRAQFAARRRAR